ncbi:hypothetical protein CW304_21630 [Bacillus sp. UFRGS-B20]|nr:hypothetical protein CW304_21630 [Bacillus sp. UFRGS-B20]
MLYTHFLFIRSCCQKLRLPSRNYVRFLASVEIAALALPPYLHATRCYAFNSFKVVSHASHTFARHTRKTLLLSLTCFLRYSKTRAEALLWRTLSVRRALQTV